MRDKMGRPWTVIATNAASGIRESMIFESKWDREGAATAFCLANAGMCLEAMIPGRHEWLYIANEVPKLNKERLRSLC